MDLPPLDWQFFYGRLAWAIVLATVVAGVLPAALRRSRPVTAGLLLASAAVMALPGEASPAYWLSLAFQSPSGMLLGFCLLRLTLTLHGSPSTARMPSGVAAGIAVAGTVLYLDAFGLLSLGLYYWGFSSYGAPLVALAAAASCALAVVLGRARPHAIVVLGALALFSILRLPTGNLWDAVLDPILWGWAVVVLSTKSSRWVLRRIRGAAREGAQAAPVMAAGIERF